jgi:hypothetical protein
VAAALESSLRDVKWLPAIFIGPLASKPGFLQASLRLVVLFNNLQ